MPRSDKYTIQTLGFALIVIGALMLIISFYTLTLSPIVLIIVGVILLIVARDMRAKQGTEEVVDTTPRE